MAKNTRKPSVRVNVQVSGDSTSVNVATTGNTTVNVNVDARRTRKPNGCILWRGASRIDGAPIAAILIFRSENSKTGDMGQVFIIRTDMSPIEASQLGYDESVCGFCVHRGVATTDKNGNPTAKGRSCYVNLGQGPNSVYDALNRGSYPQATDSMLRKELSGRNVRFGSYGDPCAAPIGVWNRLLRFCAGHTGYTHQWRDVANQDYRSLVMASCDSEADRADAHGMGWRTFRVRLHNQPVMTGEIVCPASPEGQYRRECDSCMACNGFKRQGQSDIVIIGHGNPVIMRNVNRNLSTSN
jgi:hypothetical protein